MTLPHYIDKPRASEEQLTGLEQMGAFFTSQIHDLNNQMACLCNTELLLETAPEPLPESVREVLNGMFKALHRLSGTVSRFNAVRRTVVLQPAGMTFQETAKTVRDALQVAPGWLLRCDQEIQSLIRADARWLGFVIQQLIATSGTEMGLLTLSEGPLPPRQYTRAASPHSGDVFLLLHLEGHRIDLPPEIPATPGGQNFELAMELIRLMGATVSLSRSDRPDDLLLALRLENS